MLGTSDDDTTAAGMVRESKPRTRVTLSSRMPLRSKNGNLLPKKFERAIVLGDIGKVFQAQEHLLLRSRFGTRSRMFLDLAGKFHQRC